MTQTIQLTRGYVALVDDEDYEKLSKHKWRSAPRGNRCYAFRTVGPRNAQATILLHRVIMGAPDGLVVDHINGNTLDNRKENLRLCTTAQNGFNQGFQKNNTSGYKGVSYCKDTGKWQARITAEGKKYKLGRFHTPKEAYDAYCIAAKQLHGEFARLV